MLVFTNVIYNASLHRKYTTTSNKFLTKIFAAVMQSYLTFAMAKVKIKLCHIFSLISMVGLVAFVPQKTILEPIFVE